MFFSSGYSPECAGGAAGTLRGTAECAGGTPETAGGTAECFRGMFPDARGMFLYGGEYLSTEGNIFRRRGMFFDGGESFSTEGNISRRRGISRGFRGIFFERGERKTLKTGEFLCLSEPVPRTREVTS